MVICHICNKKNHYAIKYFNQFNYSYTVENLPQAFVTMTVNDPQAPTLDTSAKYHITSISNNLHSTVPYNGTDGVMFGNDETLAITHIEIATISTSHHLFNYKMFC